MEMSPLLRLLMRVLRAGSVGTAALVALFMALEIWKRWSPDGFSSLTRQDIGFIAVMLILLTGSLLLVRSITRELRGKSGS